MKKIIIMLGLLLCMGGIAYSAQVGPVAPQKAKVSENGQRGFGPPPEAYAACKDKKNGDTATFTDRDGRMVRGVCKTEGNRLVLRPDCPPRKMGSRGGKHQPPPEAYVACKGKKAGDSAQLTDPRGETLHGTCEEQDGKLVLRPDRPRRGEGESR